MILGALAFSDICILVMRRVNICQSNSHFAQIVENLDSHVHFMKKEISFWSLEEEKLD